MGARGTKPGTVQRPRQTPIYGMTSDAMAGIGLLIGAPLILETEESLDEQILILEEHLHTLKNPAPKNRCQTDFFYFMTNACWTVDEAAGGRVALMPDHQYLREMADALIMRERLFIEKSRRVLASWAVCCFDVWLAAGGQDPRWKFQKPDGTWEYPLLNNTKNRQVFIVNRKFESSAWFLKRRIKAIADHFEEYGGRTLWPDFPKFTWKEGEGESENGSLITAVGQGSDQLRGAGATFLHIEEVAFLEQAQQTIESSLPVVKGGGHVCCVTTPNAASYAKRIRDGKLRDAERGYR